jgi:hypothetical protein
MIRRLAAILAALPLLTLAAPQAAAQAPQFHAQHGDWRVFTRSSGGDRICYATSRPTDSRPADVTHGDVYFMIANWASGAATEQPSFLTGYELRPDNPPVARVGSDRIVMYVSEREGFIEEGADERRLVDAMRRGSDMRVEATSARGTATAYTFSLAGVTAAARQAGELCR